MPNTNIPFSSLSEEAKKTAIKLARRQQRLTIIFSDVQLSTTIPDYIEIIFKCTEPECNYEVNIGYQSLDWVSIDTNIAFNCTQFPCKGRLIPEVW